MAESTRSSSDDPRMPRCMEELEDRIPGMLDLNFTDDLSIHSGSPQLEMSDEEVDIYGFMASCL